MPQERSQRDTTQQETLIGIVYTATLDADVDANKAAVRNVRTTDEGHQVDGHATKITKPAEALEIRAAAPVVSAEIPHGEYAKTLITIRDTHDTPVSVAIFGLNETGGTQHPLPTTPIVTAGTGAQDLHERLVTDNWAFLVVTLTAAGATGGTTGDIDVFLRRQS